MCLISNLLFKKSNIYIDFFVLKWYNKLNNYTRFASTAIGMDLQNVLGEASYTTQQILEASTVMFAINLITAGIIKKCNNIGAKGALLQIPNQIIVQQVYQISARVFLKEAAENIYENVCTEIINVFFDLIGLSDLIANWF